MDTMTQKPTSIQPLSTPYLQPRKKQGGKRPGAGRPADFDRRLALAKALAGKLSIGVKLGLDQVAEKYSDLMHRAIEIALDVNHPKSTEMLRFLLEIGIKVTRLDDEDDSPAGELARKWQVRHAVFVQGNLVQGQGTEVEGKVRVLGAE